MKFLTIAVLSLLKREAFANIGAWRVIEPCTNATILMKTNDRDANFGSNDAYYLEVTDQGNFVVNGAESTLLFDNECYCTPQGGTCYKTYEIKLQTDGQAFVLPQGEENECKLWKSNAGGPQGNYGLLVNHDDGEELQIWKLDEQDCPSQIIWDETNQASICYTCPHDVTILMKTNQRGVAFGDGDPYSLEVTDEGNFIVLGIGDATLFDNECYCTTPSGLCDKTFEIKLQTDGQAFVLPENENNDSKLWKSNAGGPEGTYGLLVNHDENDEVQIWKLACDDCPVEIIWPKPSGASKCYGEDLTPIPTTQDPTSETPTTETPTTDMPTTETSTTETPTTVTPTTEVPTTEMPTTETPTTETPTTQAPTTETPTTETPTTETPTTQAPTTVIPTTEEPTTETPTTETPTTDAPTTESPTCDPDKTFLMVSHDYGTSFTESGISLTVEDDGNFIVKMDNGPVLYNNACFCTGDACGKTFKIKLQTDGHAIVFPQGESNDSLLWKSNAVGPEGTYSLLVNHDDNDEVQIWKLDANDCPTEKIWEESADPSVCVEFATTPTTPTPTCDPDKSILMVDGDIGNIFDIDGFYLVVTDDGNMVVKNDEDDVLYDNDCFCTGTDCQQSFIIKLQSDGKAIVYPVGGNNDDKIWETNPIAGEQGSYALLINHDENDEVQIWKLDSDDCPVQEVWYESSETSQCYAGATTPVPTTEAPTTETPTTEPPTCDPDKTFLMVSHDYGTSFTESGISLTVEDDGNFIVKMDNGPVLYNNACFCTGDACGKTFKIKLQTDGHAIVFPQGESNDSLLWKSNAVGPKGTYSLLVNHDDNDEVQIWKLDANDCPTEKIWEESADPSVCVGFTPAPTPVPTTEEPITETPTTEVPTTESPTTQTPICDLDKSILMLNGNIGNIFDIDGFYLVVTDDGNMIVKNDADDVLYDNDCVCTGTDCQKPFIIELQSDGRAIVHPASGNNDDKIWETNPIAGDQGSYALLINHDENDEVQIWQIDSDDCPVQEVWYESSETSQCYAGATTPVPTTEAPTTDTPTEEPSSSVLVLSGANALRLSLASIIYMTL